MIPESARGDKSPLPPRPWPGPLASPTSEVLEQGRKPKITAQPIRVQKPGGGQGRPVKLPEALAKPKYPCMFTWLSECHVCAPPKWNPQMNKRNRTRWSAGTPTTVSHFYGCEFEQGIPCCPPTTFEALKLIAK